MNNRSLHDVFATLASRDVVLVKPGGNWGDELIYRGALALATHHSIRCTNLTHEQFLSQPMDPELPIYLHGGGGLNPWTSGRAITALYHALEYYRGPIIQGPQTISDDADFIAAFSAELSLKKNRRNLVFFSREERSHAIATHALANMGIHCYLDHDTAFHNSKEQLMGSARRRNRYSLFALREDNERTNRENELANTAQQANLSLRNKVTLDPAIYARTFDHWLRIHAASSLIITNRTHSAILGAILEIPTSMFASSSHKNRSVWEHSLQSFDVTWIEASNSGEPDQRQALATKSSKSAKIEPITSRYNKLKKAIGAMVPFVNLPKARAKAIQYIKHQKKQVENTRRGVPWK